jgi:hypothetical protein
MKKPKVSLFFLVVLVFFLTPLSHAQETSIGDEVRSSSPHFMKSDRPGYFQIGGGPAFGIGLGSDKIMYNIGTAYSYNLGQHLAGKLLADLYIGSGSNSSRILSAGVGGDYFFPDSKLGFGIPYISADVGYGSVRDNDEQTAAGVTAGGGAGVRFGTRNYNWDMNLHYALVMADLSEKTPSVLALRAAVNF